MSVNEEIKVGSQTTNAGGLDFVVDTGGEGGGSCGCEEDIKELQTHVEAIEYGLTAPTSAKTYINSNKNTYKQSTMYADGVAVKSQTGANVLVQFPTNSGIIATENYVQAKINEIGEGNDGKSAYEIAVEYGFEGDEEEWLASLQGEDGKPGRDGYDGVDGKDGVDGEDGIDGKDGQDGLSAYEIAVDYGFEGSEEEWLDSLHGKDGVDGVDGKDGSDGYDGKDGHTPYIGYNGNWWIDGDDTGYQAVGEDGKDGADGVDGIDGKDGSDGATPYIGNNGNWWIDGEDTGVSATGGSDVDVGDIQFCCVSSITTNTQRGGTTSVGIGSITAGTPVVGGRIVFQNGFGLITSIDNNYVRCTVEQITRTWINGASQAINETVFYAPTSPGTSGYILQSKGPGKEPIWISPDIVGGGGDVTQEEFDEVVGTVQDHEDRIAKLEDNSDETDKTALETYDYFEENRGYARVFNDGILFTSREDSDAFVKYPDYDGTMATKEYVQEQLQNFNPGTGGGDVPANAVTTDTEQTITGKKTFTKSLSVTGDDGTGQGLSMTSSLTKQGIEVYTDELEESFLLRFPLAEEGTFATQEFVEDYVAENGGSSADNFICCYAGLFVAPSQVNREYTAATVNIKVGEPIVGKYIQFSNGIGQITAVGDTTFTAKVITAIRLNLNNTANIITSIFYAPTDAGTSGQILQSNGANRAPTWINPDALGISGGGSSGGGSGANIGEMQFCCVFNSALSSAVAGLQYFATTNEIVAGTPVVGYYALFSNGVGVIENIEDDRIIVRIRNVLEINLNNDFSKSKVAFYAPTSVGAKGDILQSNGVGAPSWVKPSTLGIGSSTGNTVNGDLTVTGNLRLKGSGNYGNKINFGDGEYVYLHETPDDTLTIRATELRLNTGSRGLYINNIPCSHPSIVIEYDDWSNNSAIIPLDGRISGYSQEYKTWRYTQPGNSVLVFGDETKTWSTGKYYGPEVTELYVHNGSDFEENLYSDNGFYLETEYIGGSTCFLKIFFLRDKIDYVEKKEEPEEKKKDDSTDNTIEFFIDGESFFCERGMTWEDFMQYEDTGRIYSDIDGYVYCDGMYITYDTNLREESDWTIEEDYEYGLADPSEFEDDKKKK